MKTFRLWFFFIGLLLLCERCVAYSITPPTNHIEPWLDAWTFSDTNTWRSDLGCAPTTFTNLRGGKTLMGASALWIDTTNVARLQYLAKQTIGSTNITNINLGGPGTAVMWYSPDWCSANSTNQVGSGPGSKGRLLEAGSYGSNGWLSLHFSADGNTLYFATQTNTGAKATNLSARISFQSNSWHMIAVEWSGTNCALSVDGVTLTNGGGVTTLPGWTPTDFRIGSDSSGTQQMRGLMNNLLTYSYPLDATTLNQTYMLYSIFYLTASEINLNAPSNPEISEGNYEVKGGAGALAWKGINTNSCGAEDTNVWIRDLTAVVNGPTNTVARFLVEGGEAGVPYDVFATGAFLPTNTTPWTWLGQAHRCVTNEINFPYPAVYLLLGKPIDSDGDGLTDAYEGLVSKTDPHNAYSLGNGLSDGWLVLQGLDPWTQGSATGDPDMDGLSNFQEYQYGTNPGVSEGLSVWVSNPLTSSCIP